MKKEISKQYRQGDEIPSRREAWHRCESVHRIWRCTLFRRDSDTPDQQMINQSDHVVFFVAVMTNSDGRRLLRLESEH
jgi:hypothetical protein